MIPGGDGQIVGPTMPETSNGSNEGSRYEKALGLSDQSVFGSAPTEAEAEAALLALTQAVTPVMRSFNDKVPLGKNAVDEMISYKLGSSSFPSGQEVCRTESSEGCRTGQICPDGSNSFLSKGLAKLCHSFDLLQCNTSLQRMVVSLATDQVVWNAILKNKAVKELQQSFFTAGHRGTTTVHGSNDIVAVIMRWIIENIRTKVLDIIDQISALVRELLHPRGDGKSMDILIDVITSAFMIAVLVLIVVVVARIQGSGFGVAAHVAARFGSLTCGATKT